MVAAITHDATKRSFIGDAGGENSAGRNRKRWILSREKGEPWRAEAAGGRVGRGLEQTLPGPGTRGHRYPLRGVWECHPRANKETGSIVPRCVEGVIMESEGETRPLFWAELRGH